MQCSTPNGTADGRPTWDGVPVGVAYEGRVDGRAGPVFRLVPSAEFDRNDYRLEWLVRGVLVRGQPAVLGGGKKSLKTSLGVDLAISLGTGTPFLDHFPVRRARVAMISGESGEAVLQETARRVCRAKGVSMDAVEACWGFRLPQLGNLEHLDALAQAVQENRVDVLLIDPLYLCLLSGLEGVQASNLYQMGPLLLNAAQTFLPLGCTPVLFHHFKLRREDPLGEPQLEDLSFSGIQEFARQWVLTGRREKYEPGSGEHRLWLSVGGSAGHSGLWALDIDEGRLGDDFGGRTWEVTIASAAEVRADRVDVKDKARADKDSRKDRDDDARLLKALDALAARQPKPAGKKKTRKDEQPVAVVYTKVRDLAKLNSPRMTRSVHRLVTEGIIEEVDIFVSVGRNKGGKRPAKGLRRKPREEKFGTIGTDAFCPDSPDIHTNIGTESPK
jgi:hypothetical protein